MLQIMYNLALFISYKIHQTCTFSREKKVIETEVFNSYSKENLFEV